MSKIKYLMIHCTATIENIPRSKQDILNIFKNNGWKHPGYRHIIHLDGRLSDLSYYDSDDIISNYEITNGAKGFNNRTIHIAYIGGVDKNLIPKDTRTKLQIKSMDTLIRYYILKYPWIKIIGHNQVSSKACPSFNVWEYLKNIDLEEYSLRNIPLQINSNFKLFDIW